MGNVINPDSYRERKQLKALEPAMRAVFLAMLEDPSLRRAVTQPRLDTPTPGLGTLSCGASTSGES